MNGYILDTDTWIEFFHHRGGVADHIADTPANKIFASEISIAELTYGALHSKDVQRHLQEVTEIENTFSVLALKEWVRDYADIRLALTKQGFVVGDFDILIGVTARQYDLTVGTHNTKHFEKMPGFHCVDWVDTSNSSK